MSTTRKDQEAAYAEQARQKEIRDALDVCNRFLPQVDRSLFGKSREQGTPVSIPDRFNRNISEGYTLLQTAQDALARLADFYRKTEDPAAGSNADAIYDALVSIHETHRADQNETNRIWGQS